jgi:hypothetical protein
MKSTHHRAAPEAGHEQDHEHQHPQAHLHQEHSRRPRGPQAHHSGRRHEFADAQSPHMRGHGGRARGFGRPGGWQQAELPDASDAAAWFAGRLPADWFNGAPSVTVDREEITVIGTLPSAETDDAEAENAATDPANAAGRIARFREESREQREQISRESQARYGRSVAWGARVGDEQALFTHLSVPVMTRLRQSERQVLDTLIDAGVARSRADALAWTVRLVGENSATWLGQLRDAMGQVDVLRSEGPQL